jgi:hypothetical protein
LKAKGLKQRILFFSTADDQGRHVSLSYAEKEDNGLITNDRRKSGG